MQKKNACRALVLVLVIALCQTMLCAPAVAELERNERVTLTELNHMIQPVVTAQNSIYRLFPALRAPFDAALTPDELALLIDQFDVARGYGDRDVDGWYEPGAGAYRQYTYCNYFAADVAQARGAFLPGGLGCCSVCRRPMRDEFTAWYAHATVHGASWKVEPEQNPVYQTLNERGLVCRGDCEGGSVVYVHLTESREASLVYWMLDVGTQYGWTRVKRGAFASVEMAAQSAANQGLLTVGMRADSAVGHIIVVHPDVSAYGGDSLYISEAGARLTDYAATTHSGYTYFSFTGFPETISE